MLGQDYGKTGNVNHIKAKFGDGKGNPFLGLVKIDFINRDSLLVLSAKDHIIYTQHLIGHIDNVLHSNIQNHPSNNHENTTHNSADKSSEEMNFISNANHAIIETKPIAFNLLLSSTSTDKILVTVSKDSQITFIDISTNEVLRSYQKFGGHNQRIQIVDDNFQCIASIGSKHGPAIGEFRDPVSISSYLPKSSVDSTLMFDPS
eukprot:gene11381-15257_t